MRLSLAMTATSLGGVWHNVIDLAEGLRERGHDVRLGLSAHATAPRVDALEREFTVCSLRESVDPRNEIWHLHLHDTYEVQAMALIAARRALGPVVVTEHLPHFNGSDRSLLGEQDIRTALTARVKTTAKRSSIAACNAVIVPSERVTEFVRHRYRLGASAKLHTVPLGVPTTPEPTSILGDPIGGVLASGSIIHQKGFDLLIEAARLAKVPWRLVILGDGPHRASLAQQIEGPLADRVVLAGRQADPTPWVQRARVICLPSRWETFPYAALEAQLAARPVVAFAVDGIPEIIEDTVTGVLVDPGDVEGLAAALDALSTDVQTASQMGLAGRERAVARFGVAEMIERTETIYESVLVDSGKRRPHPGEQTAAGYMRAKEPRKVADDDCGEHEAQPVSPAQSEDETATDEFTVPVQGSHAEASLGVHSGQNLATIPDSNPRGVDLVNSSQESRLAQPGELHLQTVASGPPVEVRPGSEGSRLPLRWWPVILVAAVAIAIGTYVIAGLVPAEYKSSATLVVQVSGVNPNETATAANSVASQFAQDVTAQAVITNAAKRLSTKDANGLSSAVSGGTVAAQNVVQITATGNSPGQAQRRATAVTAGLTKYAHTLVEAQAQAYARAARAQLAPISAQIAGITSELSKIPSAQQSSSHALALQSTLSTLVAERASAGAAIAQQATGGEPSVTHLDEAQPGAQTAPKPKLYAVAAFVLALILLWRLIVFLVPRTRG